MTPDSAWAWLGGLGLLAVSVTVAFLVRRALRAFFRRNS